ncbi:hypothetical protein [Rubrivirga sp. IMCC45206]|uniref:hypothetical protein n=1 Tax=Rubrivirga sp. IMCC45206 TaxID=3391614 RepID=UPI00398FAF44
MRPDALPVRALGSRATMPPKALAALFGERATLAPSATVEVVRTGHVVARVAVSAGAALALVLDATDADSLSLGGAVVLRGPVGASGPVTPGPVCSRLVLPGGLRRAWNVPADRAAVALGPLAAMVAVADGPDAAVEVDRALWLAAGRPETARWLPGLTLDTPDADDARTDATGPLTIDRRVITETDVRQARLAHRQIRVAEGQIVTPAAASLAREAGVFADREP